MNSELKASIKKPKLSGAKAIDQIQNNTKRPKGPKPEAPG